MDGVRTAKTRTESANGRLKSIPSLFVVLVQRKNWNMFQLLSRLRFCGARTCGLRQRTMGADADFAHLHTGACARGPAKDRRHGSEAPGVRPDHGDLHGCNERNGDRSPGRYEHGRSGDSCADHARIGLRRQPDRLARLPTRSGTVGQPSYSRSPYGRAFKRRLCREALAFFYAAIAKVFDRMNILSMSRAAF
jgi:hypothetical protein